MAYETILYDVDDHITKITLNRPQYRNAQSRVLLEELDDAFKVAGADTDVRVVVLLAAGDHFSAGHDLGTSEELADREARPYEEGLRGNFERSRESFIEMTLRWRNVPKPTICGVQGYCIFGGWIIASSTDIIFAAEDAMFLGTNFQYLSIPWDMHPRQAKELMFQGRFIDGKEAKELGLVNRAVPKAELEAEVMEYAGIVAQNDPFQLRMMKLAVNNMQDAQGFHAHITAAHAMFMLSSTGERDPGYALKRPEGQRRPMVQRSLDNYEAAQKKKGN